MGAKELFDQGNLKGAIEAVTQEVKAHPAEPQRRTFLFELLCFSGDLQRADRQLDVIAHQDAMAEPAVQVYRNILHAEQLRRRLYTESLRPEFVLDPPTFVQLHLDAIGRLREQRFADASELLEQSDALRPALRGRLDDHAFEEFRDCDDVLAPFLELIMLRDYVWLPFAQIRELEISLPERPRDLLWNPVRVVLSTGAQHRAYVPVLYHGSHQHPDDQVKLGRVTDWSTSEGGPTLGIGQRMFLAGEEGRSFLDTRHVEIDA